MVTVTGHVYYGATNWPTGTVGIANVPVALYDTTNHVGAVARTDAAGKYQFTNVPASSYSVVECFGTAGLTSPVNYTAAQAAIPAPTPKDPPLSAVSVAVNPLADLLYSLTPNTVFLTVGAADVAVPPFYDSEVGNKPLSLVGIQTVGGNLITAADNGTWGSSPNGAAVNTRPAAVPYPGTTPDFQYADSLYPVDGQYTVTNTWYAVNNPGSSWYNISDHTTMMETGRFMLVNGYHPGAIIFQQRVDVKPNTLYLLTGWILNLINNAYQALPQAGIRFVASDGTVLYDEALNHIPYTPIPVWYQYGSAFLNGNDTSGTVMIYSNGPAASGNDYAIDDVMLFEAESTKAITIEKSVDSQCAQANDTLTYTVRISNTGADPVEGILFQDVMPPPLAFVPDSLTIDGAPTGYHPGFPINLGSLAPGTSTAVVFKAHIAPGTPVGTVVPNTATLEYVYLMTQNGDRLTRTIRSTVETTVISAAQAARRQAINDVFQSVALEQTALSHILNAEGEKLQKVLAMKGAAPSDLLAINKSVSDMANAIALLESVLAEKLRLVHCGGCGC